MMRRLLQVLYTVLVLPLFWMTFQVLGLFRDKIRRGIKGRRELMQNLAPQMAALKAGQRVWIHSSSLGEFEQAKPIIAELKRRHPKLRIIVTFFSPSGYEHSKRYPLADVISYIPFDTCRGARRFLDLVRPDVAVMVRYDIWPNHIWETHRRGIPLMIANATMRRQTLRRVPILRAFHHYVYNAIDDILTVSASDKETFSFFRLDHPRIEVVGDTRYDQVVSRTSNARQRHTLQPGIVEGKKILVVGSSWPEDEEVILPIFFKLQETFRDFLLILVPHEPTVGHMEELEDMLSGKTTFIRFSALNDYAGERVILVDSIGILIALYAYATVAYVGGSFRQGVHNVLEAAVYGIPVLFGPRHRNSQEPLMLVERGGGFVVDTPIELYRTLRSLLQNDHARKESGDRASAFVFSHVGATEKFLRHLEPYLTADPSRRPLQP